MQDKSNTEHASINSELLHLLMLREQPTPQLTLLILHTVKMYAI